jgi:Lrp/AsnC family transcriptional regulator
LPIAADLDRTDLRILSIVQADADLAVTEIAARVNLSQNACWRRIKRLDSEGYIARRVAILDHARLGAGMTVFVAIRTAEHSDVWLDQFRQAVVPIPEILEIYRMSGDVDYLLKLKVDDMTAYDRIYKQLIRAVKLFDVSSTFAMEEIKMTTAIALPI